MESKIQNKLAIIAILTGTYIGILALFSSIKDGGEIAKVIFLIFIVAGVIPLFHFFLYILFLPLRYKSHKKNIFTIEFIDYKITEEKVDGLFDKGANWLIPAYIGIFSYYISLKLIIFVFGNSNMIGTLFYVVGGYLLSVLFVSKVVQAEKIDKDYKFGDGFISLFKSLKKRLSKK